MKITKITSAHGVAFLALVVAVGGGLATAHNGDPDKIHLCIAGTGGNVRAVASDKSCDSGETPQDIRTQQVGFVRGNAGPTSFPAKKGFRRVSSQVIIPGDGDAFVFSGKLVVSKPANGARGKVTCKLDGAEDGDVDDVAAVTLGPGETATLSLLNRGITEGRLGETVASVIRCSSPASRYTVSHLKIAALPMDTVSKGINVPAAGQP
jgi:hypothetical protein